MDYETFEAVAAEQIAASSDLDRILRARGFGEGDIPVLSTSDEEAMSAAKRMRTANARMTAWLDANVA